MAEYVLMHCNEGSGHSHCLCPSDTKGTVNTALTRIRELIPESTVSKMSQHRRSLLPFIGDLSHTLFGTATTKEVNILKEHINAMIKTSNGIAHSFSLHSDKMQSFMTTVDKRISNVMQSVQDNHREIVEVVRQMNKVSNMVKQEETVMLSAVTVLLKHTKIAAQIEQKVRQFMEGVYNLLQGKLSPNLVPPEIIQHTVSEINTKLQNKFPGFSVTHSHPSLYYDTVQMVYARHQNSLYVTIGIPVSFESTTFELFQVETFPIALNHSTNHASLLIDIPPYFAYSKHFDVFIELTEPQLSRCQGENPKQCPVMPAQRSATKYPSCVSAIYLQNVQLIKSLCDFKLIPQGLQSQVQEIEPGLLLMSNIQSVTYVCSGKLGKTTKGCRFCVIHIPCQCAVHADNFVIPARLNNCNKTNIESVTHLHPLNLGWLQQFFSSDLLSQFNGEMLFTDPVSFNLPNFHLFQHNFTQRVASDKMLHLSLQHIAEDAKANNTVFQSLTDPIFAGEWMPEYDVFDFRNMAPYVSIGIASIACILAIRLTISFRRVIMAAAMLNQATSATAMSIGKPPPTLVWQAPILTTQPTSVHTTTGLQDIPQWLTYLTQFTLLGSLVTLIVLLGHKLYKHYKNNTNDNHLELYITNGYHCTTVPLLKLPLCPAYWTFPQGLSTVAINIQHKCTTALISIEWTHQCITNRLTSHTLPLPTTVSMWKPTARNIQQIIQTPYIPILHMIHKGRTHVVTKTTLDTDTKPEEQVKDNTKDINQYPVPGVAKLYPDLTESVSEATKVQKRIIW